MRQPEVTTNGVSVHQLPAKQRPLLTKPAPGCTLDLIILRGGSSEEDSGERCGRSQRID